MSFERGVLVRLGSLVGDCEDLVWSSDHLYVEGTRDGWSASALAAVVELDPYDEEPQTLVVEGVELRYALAGFQVKEVARNLGAASSTADRFVAGLRHFHEFDGFLEE